MSRLELLRTRREDLLKTADEHGAYNVRVFGSVARGTDDEESDVDFLVSLRPGASLFDLAGLYLALQDLLQVKVDVVSDNGLSPHLRNHILDEAIAL